MEQKERLEKLSKRFQKINSKTLTVSDTQPGVVVQVVAGVGCEMFGGQFIDDIVEHPVRCHRHLSREEVVCAAVQVLGLDGGNRIEVAIR